MNKTSLIGILVGIGAAIGGFVMDGAHLFLLWSTSSLIIVLGSTIGATILSFGMSEIKHIAPK
jgi:chemotaxis protein MotA